jgi:cyclopropane-fatty-acyl-phospholipid synthase
VVHNNELYARLLRDSELGLGESYVDGWWDEENDRLVDLLAIIVTNNLKRRVGANPRLAARFLYRGLATLPTRRASRGNAQFHYDLGNNFFRLFLDPSMTYSCGYQRSPGDSLYQMQIHKYERICRKLALAPGDRLVDIGCGWGGMLLYAAQNYGVRGLGVTLSAKQEDWARKRIAEAGLGRRVEVRLQDYRDVDGIFDKFVSIGMFEHVGREHHGAFMRKAKDLLRPGGIGLLHTIGTTGSRYPGRWLRTYIFPGTCLPRLEDLTAQMQRASLIIGHIEDWKLHYAETARRWSENLRVNRESILNLGAQYDERFLRMWRYYLQMLEAAFRFERLHLYQVLFCQGRWTLPLHFDFTDTHGAYLGEKK